MKILTANRLADGEAVWFTVDRSWAERIERAEVAADKEAETRLEAIGRAAHENNEVVDVALVDVALVEGVPVPMRLRERIRAAGPTTRLDLGKQARAELVRAA
ncbi:MAG TPA: DUF2849 domain-containing protein [Rhizobiaceae bacterium]|nr:DUF2849 domain-containing protein [Rhizobiaceae bacterium]